MITKRNPNDTEKALLRATGYFDFDSQGRFGLTELPDTLKEQIRQRLAEKRVVQHIPADMSGLRVEENTRGITAIKDGRVFLRQQSRDAKTGKISVKPTEESANKVIGLMTGKLTPQKGVRVITDNFGVAILDHALEGEEKFVIVPWHKIWVRIFKGFTNETGETIEKSLVERNSGKHPRILRIGTLIRVSNPKNKAYKGIWMVRGVQLNQRAGYLVDISEPDVIEYRGQNGEKKLPLEDVASIIITSFSASIHSELFLEAAKHGVALIICEAFKPVSLVLPANRSTDTILSRAMLNLTPRARAHLWQKTVDAKCQNQFSLADDAVQRVCAGVCYICPTGNAH